MRTTSFKSRAFALVSTTALLATLVVAAPANAAATGPTCDGKTPVQTCTGTTSDGAAYKMAVPATFNGTVTIWSHGFGGNTTIPGYFAVDSTAQLAPNGPGETGGNAALIKYLTDKGVAVIGSGPAGLAAAQQLTRAGHTVAVYDRADEIGGLLRYGIPEFKMEKAILDRRLDQMTKEGTRFRPGVNVGVELTGSQLRTKYDAIVLAVGATQWRDLNVPGRELKGIYQAMEFLPWGNRQALGEVETPEINVSGKHVVILGGGDTGADCLGTSVRQGAASVTQLEIMPRPTEERPAGQPWPTYPMIYRVSSAHEELDNRMFAVSTEEFLGDGNGNLRAIKLVETKFENGKFEPVPGTEQELPADFVFLAMGFTGPEKTALIEQLEVELDERGNIKRGLDYQSSQDGIFVAGDAGRGQSLIVWAIAEGRSAAAEVDKYLTGDTQLPAPILPTARPMMV